jgi:hypothetical protein
MRARCGPRRLRYALAFLTVIVAAAFAIPAALGSYAVVYAGPKTWLPGYDADSAYDVSLDRWYSNYMENVNNIGWQRVVFIDNNGGHWHYTTDSYGYGVGYVHAPNDETYGKKLYCANIGGTTYTARCRGERDRF